MAKKYLLYIHSKQFESESNKSGLINSLLDIHYKYPAELIDVVKSPKEVKNKLKERIILPDRLENGLCKIHNIPLDSRNRCLQKDCKYS